jgi:hypothetical protein
LRRCDNCGNYSDEAFCPSCGKPFPPPIPVAPREEQVEFEPPARVQYGTPTPSHDDRSYRPSPSRPVEYQQDGLRYRGTSEIRFTPATDARAEGALAAGVLALILMPFFGIPGLILGFVAIHYGRKGKEVGLGGANAAIAMGVLAVIISSLILVLFSILWLSF